MVGSVAFGAILGALFALYVRYVGREVTVVLLALCAISRASARGCTSSRCSPASAAGLVVQHAADRPRDVLHDAIEHGATPVLVLFFAALGASMHVEAIATVGLRALALVGASRRRLVLRLGTQHRRPRGRAGARRESGSLWRALMPTSDITLGLALLVAERASAIGARRLQTVVVAVVALHELVGPILFRAALVAGGARSAAPAADSSSSRIASRGSTSSRPDGSIVARPTPGGVSVALDALMRERGGVWIAHGAGSADRDVVDDAAFGGGAARRAGVSAAAPLADAGRKKSGYYAGFANSALWPLCHQAHVRPQFKAEDWEAYQAVNRLLRRRRRDRGAAGFVGVPQRLSPRARRPVPARAAAAPADGALLAHSVARRRSAAHLPVAAGDCSRGC